MGCNVIKVARFQAASSILPSQLGFDVVLPNAQGMSAGSL